MASSYADFFILKQGGYSTKKALLINFSVSSTIFVGIFLGYFALASNDLEVWLLALSAGFFLHVVIHDLLPTPGKTDEGKSFLLHLAFVVVGAVIMGLVATALGDSHAHGEENKEETN